MDFEVFKKSVSRETLEDLDAYVQLLHKWTAKINLISKSSVSLIWDRHIWDSAQAVVVSERQPNWVDIGSGGGLPALVVAIFAKHQTPDRRVTMIESDQRKCAFLRTVIRELNLNAEVLAQRVEQAEPQNADVISARALTELPGLLAFAERHLAPGGTALFLKGETWENEVQTARDSWSFTLEAHKSNTNPAAAILKIKEIERV